MSDARLRDLERRAADDPEARRALERERCRLGEHAWTCCDTTGAYAHEITCVRCSAVRPKDAFEELIEMQIGRLRERARALGGMPVSRQVVAEFELIEHDIRRLAVDLLKHRETVAPHRLIVMPAGEGVGG